MPENPEMIGSDEKVVEIEMERLHPFRNHPFKVTEDQQMSVLVESISKYGIRLWLHPYLSRRSAWWVRTSQLRLFLRVYGPDDW